MSFDLLIGGNEDCGVVVDFVVDVVDEDEDLLSVTVGLVLLPSPVTSTLTLTWFELEEV